MCWTGTTSGNMPGFISKALCQPADIRLFKIPVQYRCSKNRRSKKLNSKRIRSIQNLESDNNDLKTKVHEAGQDFKNLTDAMKSILDLDSPFDSRRGEDVEAFTALQGILS